jgi:hypothetical protein
MTKTEQIKHVTKSVITFMSALGYEIVDDHSGNLTFDNGSGDSRNYIDYHRTYQDVYVDLKASSETKAVVNKLDELIKLIKH